MYPIYPFIEPWKPSYPEFENFIWYKEFLNTSTKDARFSEKIIASLQNKSISKQQLG